MLGRRRRGSGIPEDPAEVYQGLRRLALSSVANGLQPPPANHPDVSGVIIDVPAQGGFATVVALTDDTTSMYTSTGGGTIGAGAHATVAAATQRLLAAVQGQLGLFDKVIDEGELPAADNVRFHVLSPTGSRCTDVPVDSFWGRAPHELVPVIVAAQRLIAAIRELSPPG